MKMIGMLPTLVAIVGVISIWAVDYCITDEFLNWNKLLVLIPLVMTIVFEIIDKNILTESLIDKLRNKYKEHCIYQYKNMIKKKLTPKEKKYEKEIIELSIKNNRFFDK